MSARVISTNLVAGEARGIFRQVTAVEGNGNEGPREGKQSEATSGVQRARARAPDIKILEAVVYRPPSFSSSLDIPKMIHGFIAIGFSGEAIDLPEVLRNDSLQGPFKPVS